MRSNVIVSLLISALLITLALSATEKPRQFKSRIRQRNGGHRHKIQENKDGNETSSEEETSSGVNDIFDADDNYLGTAINLGSLRYYTLKSPDVSNNSYDNQTLNFFIIGTAKCIPKITCPTINIRDNPKCEEEYLRIADGVGGERIFCGNLIKPSFFSNLQATMGFRDLYMYYKTGLSSKLGSSKGHTGFECYASCLRPGEIAAFILPKLGKPKKVVPCECGTHNQQERIVGGQSALFHEFSFQVALVKKNTRKPFCGGSLINDRFVLTAAHCFPPDQPEPTIHDFDVLLHAHILDIKLSEYGKNVTVEVGKDLPPGQFGSLRSPGWNLPKTNDTTERSHRMAVKKITNHPLYGPSFDYDVSLLELVEPIRLRAANAPTPVCLPKLGTYSSKYTAESAIVIGWGRSHESAGSNTRLLQKLHLPVLDLLKCNVTVPYVLTRRMICAGFMEGKRDACTGDSGGPLVINTNGKFTQIGIVSWGEGCAKALRPGIYSRVTEFNEWINHMSSEAGARWCKDSPVD